MPPRQPNPDASGSLPPGVRLSADVTVGQGPTLKRLQVRILGDDRRGYLVAGLLALPGGGDEEFWFPTLDGAMQAAVGFGIGFDKWSEIDSVSDVRTT